MFNTRITFLGKRSTKGNLAILPWIAMWWNRLLRRSKEPLLKKLFFMGLTNIFLWRHNDFKFEILEPVFFYPYYFKFEIN